MITKASLNRKLLPSANLNNLSGADLLLQYCKDINDWPDSWEIDEIDIEIGRAIVEQFKPFLIEKIEQGRAKKTIRTHTLYLWALGGELISRINEDETERRLSARELILKYIDESGGPCWRHANDEAEHVRYDSICRQLFKFMIVNPG
jgi:hypothetical protein